MFWCHSVKEQKTQLGWSVPGSRVVVSFSAGSVPSGDRCVSPPPAVRSLCAVPEVHPVWAEPRPEEAPVPTLGLCPPQAWTCFLASQLSSSTFPPPNAPVGDKQPMILKWRILSATNDLDRVSAVALPKLPISLTNTDLKVASDTQFYPGLGMLSLGGSGGAWPPGSAPVERPAHGRMAGSERSVARGSG